MTCLAVEAWGRISEKFEEFIDSMAEKAKRRDRDKGVPPLHWAKSWRERVTTVIHQNNALTIAEAIGSQEQKVTAILQKDVAEKLKKDEWMAITRDKQDDIVAQWRENLDCEDKRKFDEACSQS